jgi:hypothetical protein
MVNSLGLNDRFFKEPSVKKWESALMAGITEAEIAISDVQKARDINKCLEASESQPSLLVEHHRDFMAKAAPCIVTTHFSDYDSQNKRHWLPGDGVIDWKELICLFSKAGFFLS